jgi:hypothetical protein
MNIRVFTGKKQKNRLILLELNIKKPQLKETAALTIYHYRKLLDNI